MKTESRTRIHGHNTQAILDSATNATEKGLAQFFTPTAFASRFRPLFPTYIGTALDPHCGNGSLLDAIAPQQASLGIDIDPSVITQARNRHAIAEDFTTWFPLAARTGFTVDFIGMNPPFGLRWHSDRFRTLETSDNEKIRSIAISALKSPTIDSTLASFLTACHLLTRSGEGFMICSHATAQRLLSTYPEMGHFIFAWFQVQGEVFQDIRHTFDTAVIFFSKSHGHYAKPPTITTTALENLDHAIEQITSDMWRLHLGTRVYGEHSAQNKNTLTGWHAIAEEIELSKPSTTPQHNLWLDHHGIIRRHLTPFQQRDSFIPRSLLRDLNEIEGKRPVELVTQHTYRTALLRATSTDLWRVHPDLTTAVEIAVSEYETLRAPFTQPTGTRVLGWLDEVSTIRATTSTIPGFSEGCSYTLETSIEETTWHGDRISLTGEKENLEFKGRELLVTIYDDHNTPQFFHVRRDTILPTDTHHHHITTLLENFHIPTPSDITTQNPQLFADLKSRMKLIQSHIATRLAS